MVRTGTFFEVTLYSMHVYGTKGHSVMGDYQHDKNIFGQKLFFGTFWSIFFENKPQSKLLKGGASKCTLAGIRFVAFWCFGLRLSLVKCHFF